MPGVREKGKIAHTEWPKIVERYQAGESIAQIARHYGCTAPAIRYIIKRSDGLRDGVEPSGRGRVPVPSGRPSAAAVTETPASLAPFPRRTTRGVLAAELRKRISGDIACFLVALDQAVVDGSAGSTAELQEATDRLMRSTARIRLELERLLAVEEAAARPARGQAASSARRA
jgi:transposase-like protein